jgi:pilus biogenesis lipoprotein CpaD
MPSNISALRAACLLAGVAISAISLSGCNAKNTYLPPRDGYIQPPQYVTASLTSLNYRMELGAGQTALTRAQIDGLNRFLATSGEADGDHIEIRTTSMAGPHRNGTVANALRASFVAGGYAPSRVELLDVPGYSDAVEVVIQRYSLQTPDCSSEISRDEMIQSWSDAPVNIRKLGCSNEQGFGMMVADPRDVANDRTLAPAPGYREVGAVQRYRTDKVKELKTFSTKSQNSQ